MKNQALSVSPYLTDFILFGEKIYASLPNKTVQVGKLATAQELAQVPHLDWVPVALLEFLRLRNGVTVRWHLDNVTTGQRIEGKVDIRPIQHIYGDWKDIVYFGHEPAAWLARMQTFKIVDFFADEACVGLFHTPAKDPELHYYDFGSDTSPLGVDFQGYLALLAHTLGYRYWQLLLLELDAPTPATRPWHPQRPQTQELVQGLQQYVPGFDLQAFVARYDAVRLPTPA